MGRTRRGSKQRRGAENALRRLRQRRLQITSLQKPKGKGRRNNDATQHTTSDVYRIRRSRSSNSAQKTDKCVSGPVGCIPRSLTGVVLDADIYIFTCLVSSFPYFILVVRRLSLPIMNQLTQLTILLDIYVPSIIPPGISVNNAYASGLPPPPKNIFSLALLHAQYDKKKPP